MKKNNLLFILILIFLLVPCWLFAETEDIQNIKFGDYSIGYDKEIVLDSGDIIYYLNDGLVLSVTDTNSDGEIDMWMRYSSSDDDIVLNLEALDTNYDGEIDTVNEVSIDEKIKNIKQPADEKLKEFVLPENPNPREEIKREVEAPTEKLASFVLAPPPAKNKFFFPYFKVGIILHILLH